VNDAETGGVPTPAPAGGPALTAYPQTEAALRRTLADALVDAPSFSRPLTRCSLAACKGMCCYDGVYVGDEAAAVITDVARREAAFFRGLGLDLPDEVIVDGEWEGLVAGRKTAVAPHPFSREVADFPAHFGDTACVFHLDDGRCALQVLSVERGHHPWYYKPFTCWQHPISIVPGAGGAGAVVLLDSEETDPYRLPGYDGFVTQTFCGRTAPCGRPAHEVLAEELSLLGAIAGRDLAGELRSVPVEAPARDLPYAPPPSGAGRKAPRRRPAARRPGSAGGRPV
jgi:hypothetical protein